MPWWRQSAAVAPPASCSFKMPTICSWVNRLPRILSSLRHCPAPEDSQYPWTRFRGAGHLYTETRSGYRYRYRNAGQSNRLVAFLPSESTFYINEDHDLVSAHIDEGRARILLEDL